MRQSLYQLVNISTATAALFNNQLEEGVLDSAAEDCTTGIALATDEGTGNLFIADLTQAVIHARDRRRARHLDRCREPVPELSRV